MSEHEMIREILDRTRRIETRFTKYAESQGFDTKVRRPAFHQVAGEGVVEVPSEATALKDILAVVPKDWDTESEITITHKGAVMGALYLPEGADETKTPEALES